MATLDFSPVVQDSSVTKPAFTLTKNPVAPSPTPSALGVPATTPSRLATQTSTPASISKQPFAATAPGLALNTILGIPKATVDVTKQFLQAIPRAALSIAETNLPEEKRLNIGAINPKEDFGPVAAAAIGEDPIVDIQTKASGISHFLQQYGLSPKTSDSLGTFIGVGGTLLDVFPAGSEEKKGIENAAKLTGEELLNYFAKTSEPEKIAGILKIIGHPEAGIEDTARAMAQAKTTEEVTQVLKGGVINGENVASPLSKEATLVAENQKLMELPGTVQTTPPSMIVKNTADKILKTYEAAGRSEFSPEEFSKADEELSNILTDMELAQPGQRIFNGVGNDRTVTGVPSTFPQWVPENLRTRELFDKVTPDIHNLRYPKGVKQQALYDVVLDELDHRLGVDTKGLRSKLKINVDTEKAISKIGSGSSAGSAARVQPIEGQAVSDFKAKAQETLGREVALTAREKRLIEAGPNRQMLQEGVIAAQNGAQPQPASPAPRPTTLGSQTTFRSAGDILGVNGATQLGEGEARTIEKQAEEYLSRSGREEDVRALRDSASLKRIIEDYKTPVGKKVNLIDYIRTPEKVLTKIGLGPETKFLRSQYEGYLKELPRNIEKITEWTKRVPASSNVRLFKYLDGQAIDLNPTEKKVAEEIKAYLSDWADRLKLPEDKRIANYITHLFDDQLIRKEFDEDLVKIIRDKIPGEVYDPFLEKRMGALGYKEDTWAALDAYTKRATRKFYMDPALERISDKAQSFEDSQWNYVKRYLDSVNMRPTETETLIDNWVKQKFGYRGGQRPFTRISQKLRQMVYRGALGLNVGSAVRNLTQGVNTYAELGEKYTAKGYIDLMRNGTQELKDVGILNDDFVQDRTISAVKSTLQKIDTGLFAMFETVEKINRGSAYYGAKARALAQGKDELTAVEEAKDLVRKTQFSLGKIDTPVALQSDIIKTLLQFQSFTIKQAEFLSGKVAKREWAGLIRYVVGSLVVLATLGKLFGMKWQDIIPIPLQSRTNPGLSTPPLLQPVIDSTLPLYSQKDKNGNPLTTKTYFKQLGADLVPFIPAGAQVKKTLQGVGAVVRGKVKSNSGKTNLYKVPQDKVTLTRAALFGKSNLPQTQEYYSKIGQPKKKSAAKLAF